MSRVERIKEALDDINVDEVNGLDFQKLIDEVNIALLEEKTEFLFMKGVISKEYHNLVNDVIGAF